jgi:hypothetical protein
MFVYVKPKIHIILVHPKLKEIKNIYFKPKATLIAKKQFTNV